MSEIYLKHFPELDENRLTKLIDLRELYLEWNEKINVISRKDTSTFEVNHVLHSLSIAKSFQFEKGSEVLDFGSGGGFPGIPLAIFFPDVTFTLVDSIAKKMKVASAVADSLKLDNVKIINGRVEDLKQKFDFITCRAVGRIGKIMPWVRDSLSTSRINQQKNGFIFLKGGDLSDEMKETKLPYRRIPISSIFEEEFFETKEIIYLSRYLKNRF